MKKRTFFFELGKGFFFPSCSSTKKYNEIQSSHEEVLRCAEIWIFWWTQILDPPPQLQEEILLLSDEGIFLWTCRCIALPPAPELAVWWAIDPHLAELVRSAFIGFCASSISDCISNAACKAFLKEWRLPTIGSNDYTSTPIHLFCFFYLGVFTHSEKNERMIFLKGSPGFKDISITQAAQLTLKLFWGRFGHFLTSTKNHVERRRF